MWNSFSITVHFLTLILFESFKFSDFKFTDLESCVQISSVIKSQNLQENNFSFLCKCTWIFYDDIVTISAI